MVLRSFLPHGIAAPFGRFFDRKGPAAAHSANTEMVRQAAGRMLDAARLEPDQALLAFQSSPEGLSQHQVHEMRQRFGANILAAKGKDSLPKRLFASFINPFSVVLLLLAGISFFTDYLLASADEKDLTAVIIVAVMVCISGVLHFVQEPAPAMPWHALNRWSKQPLKLYARARARSCPSIRWSWAMWCVWLPAT